VMPADLLPRQAHQASRFQIGEKVYRVTFRPVLPAERACARR